MVRASVVKAVLTLHLPYVGEMVGECLWEKCMTHFDGGIPLYGTWDLSLAVVSIHIYGVDYQLKIHWL